MAEREDIDVLLEALIVDQILLRAVIQEVFLRLSEGSDQAERAKMLADSMQSFIDRYRLPGADAAIAEKARETARKNLDDLVRVALRRMRRP